MSSNTAARIQRILYFGLIFGWLIGGFIHFMGTAFYTDPIHATLFASLLTLAIASCFVEHFFTKPTDVIAATLGILLLMLPMKGQLDRFGTLYTYFLIYAAVLLIMALAALILFDETRTSASLRNVVSKHLKHVCTYLGRSKILYSTLFLLTLIYYVERESLYFIWLTFTLLVLITIEPQKLIASWPMNNKLEANEIGEIFGVQSRNIFLVKLSGGRKVSIKRFDFVEFRYSMDEDGKTRKGLIIDNCFLNQEQWVKVLWNREIELSFPAEESPKSLKKNIVYKLEGNHTQNEFLTRFVGVVIESSDIENIRFEYASNPRCLKQVVEGSLLEVTVRGKKILHQVVQGVTAIENLESKDEAGIVVGQTIQLGCWSETDQQFEKFGWVPEMNTPIMLAEDITTPTLEAGEYLAGKVPDSNFPCILKLDDAVSHHTAILGVTGSGKSVFARDLVRHVAVGWKVICVDFTGEYKGRFSALNPVPIIKHASESVMFKAIEELSIEYAQFKNQQRPAYIEERRRIIFEGFKTSLEEFLKNNDSQLAVFELPDVSNTEITLDYTKWFFKTLFNIAKKENNFGKKVCVVLEEAHTVVPEWNFAGIDDKVSKSLVNSVAQIALQGRKYNIGFIVIAQRTANVSKTVLTQCNSIITFQQFDKTSGEFFSNFFGSDMVAALPRLKKRQAIAVGKAFKANMPMIFEVPDIEEEPYVLPQAFIPAPPPEPDNPNTDTTGPTIRTV